MDLFSPFSYLWALFAFFSFVFMFYKYKSPPSNLHLPPGKFGLPLIGETFEYVMGGLNGHPDKFLKARMKKYSSKIFKTSLIGDNMVVFCGPEGNKFLFTNVNKLVTSWWPRSLDKVLYPSNNTTTVVESAILHGFLHEFLKAEALRNYVIIMDSIARQHMQLYWAPNDQVKAFQLSKKFTFATALKLFMNIDDPELVARVAHPFALITAGLISMPINLPGTAFNHAVKGGKLIRKELVAIITQKRKELSEKKSDSGAIDLLTRMLLHTDGNGKLMNDEEIADKIIGLLLASHDTTSIALTFVLNYVAEFPDIHNKVFQELIEIKNSKGPEELLNWDDIQKMKYSWCVARESMRLCPPGPGAFRETLKDITYAGFTIPKGWKAYWTVHTTHKNEAYFPNPEQFDPSRFEGNGPAPFTFVPFGGGPRMCPGKEYARLQILVFMYNVVTNFKLEKLIPNEKIKFEPSPIPVNGLPVRLQRYDN